MITSADEFVALRLSTDPTEYGRAAVEPASDDVWLQVISQHPEMREWVAHNKSVPMSVLRVLASDQNANVRQSVAMKRKLDRELFEKLSRDPDEAVRLCIARNRKTPTDLLQSLVIDEDGLVAAVAAERLAYSA